MKNTTLLLLLIGVVIVMGFLITKPAKAGINGNVIDTDSASLNGEIQKVIISERDLNYYPSEIKVKANQPVEITLDDSVKGCLRYLAIRDFNILKYAKTPSDKIIFTPNRKGSFTFSCSMGMGYGKFVVE